MLFGKELISVYSMEEQARIREILSGAGIGYKIKTKNRLSPSPMAAGSRARSGSLGQDLEHMLEYTILVKQNDYEQATHLIGR